MTELVSLGGTPLAYGTHTHQDPAAHPQNPSKLLAAQKSQFADLLSFGKGKGGVSLKERVGPRGHNPFLEEIERRLKDPNSRAVLLEKSLVTRDGHQSVGPQRKPPKKQSSSQKSSVLGEKSVKIATKDIYDSIRV